MGSRIFCRRGFTLVSVFLLASLVCTQQLPAFQEEEEPGLRGGAQNRYANEWEELLAENYDSLVDPDGPREGGQEGWEQPEFSGILEVMEHWPVNPLQVGDIGGVATDPEGYVYVLHRGSRAWTESSFNEENIFTEKDKPIKEHSLVKINGSNGIILDKRLDNVLYMPHGLTIDSAGNKWVTDVALHQVFKYEPNKYDPSLILGKKFEPANSNEDTERFCKPTDVAVASNGDFFVADGYCASRIMKFSSKGELILQFGIDDAEIPHSVTLAEELDLVCVADREGMRILCYNAGIKDPKKLGEPEREYTDEQMGRVFAIEYSPKDGVIYGVTGVTGVILPQGFTIDLTDDDRYKTDLIALWGPIDKSFEAPHDLAVSPDGESVFVGELSEENPLWKFVKED